MHATKTNFSGFVELEDSSHATMHCFVWSDVNLRVAPSSSANTQCQHLLSSIQLQQYSSTAEELVTFELNLKHLRNNCHSFCSQLKRYVTRLLRSLYFNYLSVCKLQYFTTWPISHAWWQIITFIYLIICSRTDAQSHKWQKKPRRITIWRKTLG